MLLPSSVLSEPHLDISTTVGQGDQTAGTQGSTSPAQLLSSFEYLSLAQEPKAPSTSSASYAMCAPTEGDIFSAPAEVTAVSPAETLAEHPAGRPLTQHRMSDFSGVLDRSMNSTTGSSSLVTLSQLPPGATIVYMTPFDTNTFGNTSHVLSSSSGSPYGVSMTAGSTNFEENFNVLSDDKQTMLSIPKDIIDPTAGSAKYLQQGTSACYTFRFQLCRGYNQGRCVHRHQCAFIHSRHMSNPALSALVTRTLVHRNVPIPSFDAAPHPRLPRGVTLLVYDSVQSKNVLIDSSYVYVTHGSQAGYRAAQQNDAALAATGQPTAPDNSSESTTNAQGSTQPTSSVRLQFCLHFDKSLCARGETCNFVHKVQLQEGSSPHSNGNEAPAAAPPPPFSGTVTLPTSASPSVYAPGHRQLQTTGTTFAPTFNAAPQAPAMYQPCVQQHPVAMSYPSSGVTHHFSQPGPQFQPQFLQLPLHASMPPFQQQQQQLYQMQPQLFQLPDGRLVQSWPPAVGGPTPATTGYYQPLGPEQPQHMTQHTNYF